jgi:hypothetical protein
MAARERKGRKGIWGGFFFVFFVFFVGFGGHGVVLGVVLGLFFMVGFLFLGLGVDNEGVNVRLGRVSPGFFGAPF